MYKQLFIDYMDQNEKRYENLDDRLCISFDASNTDTIKIHVFFDKNGNNIVQMKCWSFPNLNEKKEASFSLLNELNSHWRWLSFSIDEDGDVCSSLDSYLDANSCGEICWSLVSKIADISDKAYPQIAKLRWS